MILFYCTFLALKGQDIAEPVVDLPDTFLKHEDEIFAGLVIVLFEYAGLLILKQQPYC